MKLLADLRGHGRLAIRHILLPSGALLLSNALSSVLGLAALGLLTRSLSLIEFGIFSVATSYTLIISRLVGFQSWQPVLRLAEMPRHDNVEHRSALLGLGFKLDLAAAAAAGLVSLIATPLLGFALKIDASQTWAIAVYGLVNITAIIGAPTAVLRLYRRHDLLGGQAVAASLLKVIAVALVFVMNGGLLYCLAAWALAQMAGNLALVALGEAQARRRGVTMLAGSVTADLRRFPGLLRDFVETNLVQTTKMFRDGDVLVVGLLLNVEAAAVFRIARQMGDIAVKATDPLMIVLFPEFARLAGRGDHDRFRLLLLGSLAGLGISAAAAFGLYAAFGEQALAFAFGPEYDGAYVIVGLCILAGLTRAVSQAAPSAMLARGAIRPVIHVMVITGLLYYAGLFLGARVAGLTGVGVGLLAASILSCAWLVAQALRIAQAPEERVRT